MEPETAETKRPPDQAQADDQAAAQTATGAEASDPAQDEAPPAAERRGDRAAASQQAEPGRQDLGPELAKLVLLTTKYPEVGPPLAELAFKAGYPDEGNQILKLALGGEAPSLEFFFVAARHARQGRRYDEALRACVDAVRAVAAAPERYAEPDDAGKLLHLVRNGFSILLFDLKDVNGNPGFIEGLEATLPGLGARLDADPFFHSLLAQVLWFRDRAAGDQEWERAAERGEHEFTYNARGTWYKEAERDADKAEQAYRQGLEKVPTSPLLAHNLAQLLLDKATRLKEERPGEARRAVSEGENLVRIALQGDCPGGLRRHIYSTRAELSALRSALRPRGGERERGGEAEAAEPPRPPRPAPPKLEVGGVLTGRVSSLTAFGAFISVGGGLTGLLHKSELAYEPVADPAELLQIGQQIEVKIIDLQEKEGARPRIGLSRKALLPPPPPSAAPPAAEARAHTAEGRGARPRGRGYPAEGRGAGPGPQDRNRPEGRRDEGRPVQGRRDDTGDRRDDRRDRPGGGRPQGGPRRPESSRPTDSRLASLGEMLLAKLKEQENKGS